MHIQLQVQHQLDQSELYRLQVLIPLASTASSRISPEYMGSKIFRSTLVEDNCTIARKQNIKNKMHIQLQVLQQLDQSELCRLQVHIPLSCTASSWISPEYMDSKVVRSTMVKDICTIARKQNIKNKMHIQLQL
jgi:hypothetical protein